MRLILVAVLVAACGPDTRPGTNSDGGVTPDAFETACVDGVKQCVVSTLEVCANGQWMVQEECPAACDNTLGCVACNPNQNVCNEGNVHTCDATGQLGPVAMECTGSTVCQLGQCVDACADAAEQRSYTGCEYWAVDLDNAVEVDSPAPCASPYVPKSTAVCTNGTLTAGLCDPPGTTCPSGYTCQTISACVLDAQHSPFAIVVSNPQARAVEVTVTAPDGVTTFSQTVAAGAVAALMPQQNGIPDQSIDGSGIEKKAYKVTSNLPIVAYQFNPLDNVDVFSNDASLLIPRLAFDVEYYAMTRATLDRRTPAPGKNAYRGYLSIVAWQDGTVVEVTPSALTTEGPAQPAIAANTPTMFTLDAHEVLTLQAAGVGDLTGTKVRSVGATPVPVGVFAGHEATAFGEGSPCCADHLEDMMFPTSTWGKTFAIGRTQPRGGTELDVVRIVALEAGTTLQFNPAPIGNCPMLAAGAYCEVKINADTAIVASKPVQIAHYLQSNITLFGGEGDPSMAIAVPAEQFRTDYTILVPSQYAKNFVTITAPITGAILVDGMPVQLQAFGGNAYRGGRFRLMAGQHKIACPGTCGVEVYGYGDAVSYMFAGGLDLKQIVIQ